MTKIFIMEGSIHSARAGHTSCHLQRMQGHHLHSQLNGMNKTKNFMRVSALVQVVIATDEWCLTGQKLSDT